MDVYLLIILFIAVLTSNGTHVHKKMEKQAKDLKTSKAEEEMLLLKTHHLECIDEARVDPDLVVKFKAGDWRNSPPLLRNWVLCVLHRLGLMSREGVYKLDKAMSKISEKDAIKAETLIFECLPSKATAPADIAWEYVNCLHLKDPKGNFSSISIIR